LDGLDNLTSVGDFVRIGENTSLTNLDALRGLTAIGERLFVYDNVALTSCSCGIGAILTNGGIAGSILIQNNATGCNSPEEVLATTCDDPTAVDEPESIPQQVALHASYPNPFRTETTFTFELPTRSEARLVVYDITARTLSTLIDGSLPPGVHRYTWHAAGVPAGVYYYRLEAGDYVATKSMLLIK